MEYEAVIGLEIHVQMDTQTKLFCGCKVEFGAEPNTNVCPVCLGMPGALPVLNKRAVEYAVRASLALNCEVHLESIFARKNYFYPDLPKGYQISQYERPIATDGYLEFELPDGSKKRVRIRRLHMEEDAGKSIHEGSKSYVDLNRAGTPLMEIVTEPDLSTPEEARVFLENLRNIMRYVGVSKADMEKGQLRCDINVSIRPKGSKELGTRTEIKNVNSFRFVQKALEYEIERQIKLVSEGGRVEQETRTFDPSTGKTFTMRTKEEAEDYRYFPDPDLLPLKLEESWIEEIRNTMPELPHQRLERLLSQYGISEYEAKIFVQNKELGDFFEEAVSHLQEPKLIANWLLNDLLGLLNEKQIPLENSPVSPEGLAELVKLIKDNVISTKIGKEVIRDMVDSGKRASQIVEEKGLKQITDESSIRQIVEEVVKQFPEEAQRYRQGEDKLIGFFVGQVMKSTKGKANPKLVNQLLREVLKG
ncbi:aspartyl/glutamyl-tRNA(Asn/Gln) amidotransferase subunit B [Hydrogenivirga caldilitoris]|uniref:Aspartyl/glutamyl-tRNA(Asn/Gln) amidotransferase subunit B n=1 Tax=Hydrogenivirga caldilitoris TaxID=246264 RepID=A0A497XRM6_9AQUI|nr:Asp-tRNA(Asn)/Glu-tRNA(Gln) amidotransferase subunit GatB [Hydrogenivirga caldilitoris]RLJ69792.1 aspartyl/glutamyl-tRNA(Asn/Gln) amidotransferase subunit B [Hydrogenivirga caldilitoris]